MQALIRLQGTLILHSGREKVDRHLWSRTVTNAAAYLVFASELLPDCKSASLSLSAELESVDSTELPLLSYTTPVYTHARLWDSEQSPSDLANMSACCAAC